MKYTKLELFLSENEGREIEKDGEMHRHMGACRDCKEYLLFTKILYSQKEVFEKAPETILSRVRQRIHERQNCRERSSILDIFRPLVKPAIAFLVLLLAATLYTYLKNSPIGVIDNLADRFNISELKNIQTGDILYVAKQIRVECTLNGQRKMALDSNTVLQLRAKDKIILFRGQLYADVGKKTLALETPNGVITVKNAKIKVHTAITNHNGGYRAKTSCSVIEGIAEIGNSREKVRVSRGEEIVLGENGKVELKRTLPGPALAEKASRLNAAAKSKVFTAKEDLCDCLYDVRYKLNDNQLHGKEVKENKFPVRIFWQNEAKIESRRRLEDAFCFFNAGNDRTVFIGYSPGI